MNYRVLGKTGLTVSEIGFGTWGTVPPAHAGIVLGTPGPSGRLQKDKIYVAYIFI